MRLESGFSLGHYEIRSALGVGGMGEVHRAHVMELVEGETLAERIGRGAIPISEALPLFLQIAEELEAAYEKGIIRGSITHRHSGCSGQ